MVTASDRSAAIFSFSPRHVHDALEDRALLDSLKHYDEHKYLLLDRAYEGQNTRNKVLEKGLIPIVPPLTTRKEPWRYDMQRALLLSLLPSLFVIFPCEPIFALNYFLYYVGAENQ